MFFDIIDLLLADYMFKFSFIQINFIYLFIHSLIIKKMIKENLIDLIEGGIKKTGILLLFQIIKAILIPIKK